MASSFSSKSNYFVEDEAYFRETFALYTEEFLKQEIPTLKGKVLPFLENILSKTCQDTQKPIDILSVGAGNGKPDLFLIRELFGQFPKFKDRHINYTVIEPNHGYITFFQEAVRKNSGDLKNVEFRWYCDTFEQVAYADYFSSKFDMILLYHVLYYMEVDKTRVKCMDDLIKPGGCMLCVSLTEDDCSKKVYQRCHSILNGLWHGYKLVSTEQVRTISVEREWKFEYYTCDGSMDVTAMFDPYSRDGRLLLDFAFHTKNVVDLLGPDSIAKVLNAVKQSQILSSSPDTDEVRVFKQRGMIIVYKE